MLSRFGNRLLPVDLSSDRQESAMDELRVIEIKKNVFENNDKEADLVRSGLKKDGVFLLNLMSSPGSGKTSTVMRTIESLKNDFSMGVIEADLDSDVDARKVHETGVKVVQVHSGGMCHLNADMTRQGLASLGTEGLDLVILENIGNLICTAGFDTGASRNAMILSTPEGDDKPLKYPVMFEMADALIVNKIDVAEYFDFSLERLVGHVRKLNPDIAVFPLSAKTGEGVDAWNDWLRNEVRDWRNAS
jgi:hydrogenase nickel incorporation protein HypB